MGPTFNVEAVEVHNPNIIQGLRNKNQLVPLLPPYLP